MDGQRSLVSCTSQVLHLIGRAISEKLNLFRKHFEHLSLSEFYFDELSKHQKINKMRISGGASFGGAFSEKRQLPPVGS